MATLTVHNLDPAVEERLRILAAEHGHSIEAEVRAIVTEAVGNGSYADAVDLAEAIRHRFAPLGGIDDLEIPPRETMRDPPRFD